MFDFLQRMKSAIVDVFDGPEKGGSPGAAKTPPPVRPGGPALAESSSAPASAASEVFSGMVDEQPKNVHTLGPSPAPTFGGADPASLMGEATPEKLIQAAKTFDQPLNLQGGADAEAAYTNQMGAGRDNLFYKLFRPANEKSAVDIGVGSRVMPLAHETPVADIESPAGRLQTMNMLAQNKDPNDPDYDPTAGASCTASSLVAGVLYAEGRKGLTTLLSATHKPGEEEDAKLKALREKLENKSEKLSLGDLQDLQSMVYYRMKDMEGADPETLKKQITSKDPVEQGKAFVQTTTVDKFMEQVIPDGDGPQRSIADIFKKSNLEISAIDNDGDAQANHCILRIADEEHKVVAYYDPWMKKGTGGQIVNAEDDRKDGKGPKIDPTMTDYKKAGAEQLRSHYSD